MKKRELNLELLRIISMFIVIVFHFSDWGGLLKINTPYISPDKLLGELINIGGSFGNDIFVLISGYFLINTKFKTKKLLKIVLEVFFYSMLMYGVCLLFGIVKYNIDDLRMSLFPITYNMYWFATTYVVMYLLSPYINFILNNINKKQHLTLIIILLILVSIIPSIFVDSKMFSDNLIRFIFLYITAAYIKKYVPALNKKTTFGMATLGGVLLFGISLLYTKLGFDKYITVYNTMTTVPMLLLTISSFLFFRDLKIDNNNKIIPFFASSAFAVYLIHINRYFRVYLFNNILHIQDFYDSNTLLLAGYILIASIIIYISCSIIDFIRRKLLEEPLFKLKFLDNLFDKIDNNINIDMKVNTFISKEKEKVEI